MDVTKPYKFKWIGDMHPVLTTKHEANLQNYTQFWARATSYAQYPANQMLGASFGRPEGPKIARGRSMLTRFSCQGQSNTTYMDDPGWPPGNSGADHMIHAINGAIVVEATAMKLRGGQVMEVLAV